MVWGVPGWLGKFDKFRVRSHEEEISWLLHGVEGLLKNGYQKFGFGWDKRLDRFTNIAP